MGESPREEFVTERGSSDGLSGENGARKLEGS